MKKRLSTVKIKAMTNNIFIIIYFFIQFHSFVRLRFVLFLLFYYRIVKFSTANMKNVRTCFFCPDIFYYLDNSFR